jgi:hypothetical protein
MLYREIVAVYFQIHAKHINVFCVQNVVFLDAFTKSRKATISFIVSISPFAWDNSMSSGHMFIKSGIFVFFENLSTKFNFH